MRTKMTEQYEKPVMKFVELRNREEVANTCWGYHGTGTNLYCDIPGEGYVSFQISGGSCGLGEYGEKLVNVLYYEEDDGAGVEATNQQKNILFNILNQSGGTDGNPYKGEGTIVIPDHPGDWS